MTVSVRMYCGGVGGGGSPGGVDASFKAFPASVSVNQIGGGALMGFVSNIFMMQVSCRLFC